MRYNIAKDNVRKWLASLLVLAALTCLIAGILSAVTTGGVLIQGADIDAGAIKAGTKILTIVKVINLSTSPLLVSTISTCGCTTVPLTQERVLPFHTLNFSAKVDTTSMKPGTKNKDVIVYLESGKRAWQRTVNIKFVLK